MIKKNDKKMEMTASCKKCQVQKDLISFQFIAKTKTYVKTCRDCRNQQRRDQYPTSGRKERDKCWRLQNSNFKNQQLEYRSNRKEIMLETQRQYRSKLKGQNSEIYQRSKDQRKYNHKVYNALQGRCDMYYSHDARILRAWMKFSDHDINVHQVDHVLPIAKFTTERELYVGLHWGNLQPLTRDENARKQGKVLPFFVYFQELRLQRFADSYPEFSSEVRSFIPLFTKEFNRILQDDQIVGDNSLSFNYHSSL